MTVLSILYLGTITILFHVFLDRRSPLEYIRQESVQIVQAESHSNVYIKYALKSNRICSYEGTRYLTRLDGKFLLKLSGFNEVTNVEKLNIPQDVIINFTLPNILPDGIYVYTSSINFFCNPFQKLFNFPIRINTEMITFIKDGDTFHHKSPVDIRPIS